MASLTCFKAYDIRGKLGSELNTDIAYRIGRACGQLLGARTMVVGGDVRLTSEELKLALADGLMDAGVDVIDIGLCGTEEVYFAVPHLQADGGICVTASHNPIDYNGMKLVKAGSQPISGDSGLHDIKRLAESQDFAPVARRGQLTQQNILDAYVAHLLTYIEPAAITPLKLVVNAGNGAAGHVVDALEQQFRMLKIPVEFIKVHHEPDGTFPNGIPNPLLPEKRQVTTDAVIAAGANMGIAWDGDFDRCFLFDERGEFVEGYYIVGLLAEAFLLKHQGEKIIHDPRLVWNTQDIVQRSGGIAVMSKTGHAFIKERMRKENAIYGGEMSAHHYFRDFHYCDSGMIPWLLVMELLCRRHLPLSALLQARIDAYPSSGEINLQLANAPQAIAALEQRYAAQAVEIDRTDGLSMSFEHWRLNLRSSNTEPVVRLNVETRGDAALMRKMTDEVLAFLRNLD
jgi:phosphomannomutase